MTTKTNEIWIDFRLRQSGSPSETNMMALDWIRSNRDEAINLIAKIKSFEFIAKNGGTPEAILWAEIEAIDFLSSLAREMELKVSAATGCDPSDYWKNRKQSIDYLAPHSLNTTEEVKPEPEEVNEIVNKPIEAPSYGDFSGF